MARCAVIINAAGIIMMVNQAGCRLFGYDKGELEGKNVSVLMPQPFSQRHNGFLSRYISTGEARILDSQRHVVALHKEHTVFPVTLCVTKLSGTGQDSVFMGIVRETATEDKQLVKARAPAGAGAAVAVRCAAAHTSRHWPMQFHRRTAQAHRLCHTNAPMRCCNAAFH